MFSVVESVALLGLRGDLVRVEVSLTRGLPAFVIVGLPDTSVREARERVRAAVVAAGFQWPQRRIVVNLAPAGVPKSGSWFDLPIALGILTAAGVFTADLCEGYLVVGELALSGSTASVPGVLSAAICARREGRQGLLVPEDNVAEAASVPGGKAVPVGTLTDLASGLPSPATVSSVPAPPIASSLPDMGDVAGQEFAKFGLQVAAAGGHHCLLLGEPGSGKTMLARRLPRLLPLLDENERLEASAVHSLAGELSGGLLYARPFRSPHHSVSAAALVGGGGVGGGGRRVRPGELSLAHNGVLFLDELGEFPASVLNMLREPLESGEVRIARFGVNVVLPARVWFVGAANPCPCGYDGSATAACICDMGALRRYQSRLGGPLRDRIDLTIPVTPVSPGQLLAFRSAPLSDQMAKDVAAARERQLERNGGILNAALGEAELERYAPLSEEASVLLRLCARRWSSRGLVSARKVARTIADLDGARDVTRQHMREAVAFRRCPGEDERFGARGGA